MKNIFESTEEEKNRIRSLHNITEQVKEGDSNYTIPYNEDYIQEWVDRWNSFIYDRLDGGYGGPNDIQSEIDYELRTLCPEVMEVLQASYDIWGWNIARNKSWVDNNIQTQIVPKIEEWKNNGGDMTTLERPEINLEKDCPDYQGNKDIK